MKMKVQALAALALLGGSFAAQAVSIANSTWVGSWAFFPSSGFTTNNTEDLTIGSQTANGDGTFNVTGGIRECFGTGCVVPSGTNPWNLGTLNGNVLTLNFSPTAANSYEGYDLTVTIIGNTMSGLWTPVGSGYAALVVDSGSCDLKNQNNG